MLKIVSNNSKKVKKITFGYDLSVKGTGMAISINRKVVDYYKFKQTTKGYKVLKNGSEVDLIPLDKVQLKSSPIRGHFVGKYIEKIVKEMNISDEDSVFNIFEAPAYEAVGKHYNIAEFCGVVKSFILLQNPHHLEISPTKLKKAATGHGSASKDDICYALNKFYKIDSKGDDDIADACFLSLLFA